MVHITIRLATKVLITPFRICLSLLQLVLVPYYLSSVTMTKLTLQMVFIGDHIFYLVISLLVSVKTR